MEPELDYGFELEDDVNQSDPFALGAAQDEDENAELYQDISPDEAATENSDFGLVVKAELISPLGDKSLDEAGLSGERNGDDRKRASDDGNKADNEFDEEFYIGRAGTKESRAKRTSDEKVLSDVSSCDERYRGDRKKTSNDERNGSRGQSRRSPRGRDDTRRESDQGSHESRGESRKRKSSPVSRGSNTGSRANVDEESSSKRVRNSSREKGDIQNNRIASSHSQLSNSQQHQQQQPMESSTRTRHPQITGPECSKDSSYPVSTAAGLNVDSRSSHLALAALAAEAEGSGGALSEEAERELWLKELFQSARFYMIKSRNDHNVQLAKEKNVWSTTPQNEPRLNKAFKSSRNVILLFSVTESQRFAGFARLASESCVDAPMPPWQLPPGMSIRALSGVFQLDWITKEELLFAKTLHLYNEWNLRKPVKIGRDGQEIEPVCGEKLCRLFDFTPQIDIYSIVKRVRAHEKARNSREEEPQQHHDQFPHSRGRGYWRGGGGYHEGGYYRGGFRGGYRGGYRGFGSFRGRGGGYYPDRYDEQSERGGYYSQRRERSKSPYRGEGSSRPRGFNDDYRDANRRDQIPPSASTGAPGRSERDRDRSRERRDAESGSRHRETSGDRSHNHNQNNRERGNSPSYHGDISKETMMHGSYNDYMREFHKQMQRAYPGFPGPFPPPFMGMQFYPPPFSMPPPNLAAAVPAAPHTTSSASSKAEDIETHAKLVDKFLKNTRHRSDSSASRSDYEEDSRRQPYSDDERGDSYSEDDGDYSDEYDTRRSGGRHTRSRSNHRRAGMTRRDSRSQSRGASEDEDSFIQYSSKSAQRRY
ncbi:uncharacterized protein LOC142342547 isoform X2 [Convolutriloba macropyga]|uniref:uncharacterized protein LOC142342547 isoform X2 n=1 Tax=Convolutriloba macropyga TaxID=536237 RepID=UPI003F51D207